MLEDANVLYLGLSTGQIYSYDLDSKKVELLSKRRLSN